MADTTTPITAQPAATAPAATAAPATDHLARGKVMAYREGTVVFTPSNTTYELHLACPNYDGPFNALIEGVIRVDARKAWTVPSGGNFISPIFGPPRTVQGRVMGTLGDGGLILKAGVPMVVHLPDSDRSIELTSGALTVGSLMNATILPGARFEPAAAAAK